MINMISSTIQNEPRYCPNRSMENVFVIPSLVQMYLFYPNRSLKGPSDDQYFMQHFFSSHPLIKKEKKNM